MIDEDSRMHPLVFSLSSPLYVLLKFVHQIWGNIDDQFQEMPILFSGQQSNNQWVKATNACKATGMSNYAEEKNVHF